MKSTTKTALTQETIQKIMTKHFGDVIVRSVDELTEGWFNAIYVVNYAMSEDEHTVVIKTGVEDGKYILTYEKNIMQTELEVYDLLASNIIPTPTILARDFSHELADCNYFIMEYMTGDNWGHLNAQITPENKDLLVAELAQYTAALHQNKGNWYGYLKNDTYYQHETWREAFKGMVQMQIDDANAASLETPFEQVLETFEPLWYLLDEITEPSLVNFDMWTKNIMLKQGEDGLYHIDAILDFERCFYGDAKADFISSNTIVGDVSSSSLFQENYSKISGKEFTFDYHDKVRQHMYLVYLMMLGCVEIYRSDDPEIRTQQLSRSSHAILGILGELKELAKEL